MTNENKILALKVLQGQSSGTTCVLKSDSCSIGTGNNCTLRVIGRHISDVHAVLGRQADGNWAVTNKSPNGSFVNQKRIQTQILQEGDVLQIGVETLIRLENVGKPAKIKRDKSKQDRSSVRAGLLGKRPGMMIGISAYLLALVAAGVYLSTSGDSVDELALLKSDVESALAETSDTLQSKWQALAMSDDGDASATDTRTEEAHLYYSIVSAGTTDADRERAINELVRRAGDTFFLAWQMEQQGNEAGAREQYEIVIGLAPDLRLQITWLAARQLKRFREGSR